MKTEHPFLASARQPLDWPAAIPEIADGAAAFAFVAEAATYFPGLIEGVGAPVLDPLLRCNGFVEQSARAADHGIGRRLAFRLAFLGLLTAEAVDRSTADRVAVDIVACPSEPLAAKYSDEAERIFASDFRPALTRAVLAAPTLVPAFLVRRALSDLPEEAANLALASDDVAAALEGHASAAVLAAVVAGALALPEVGAWRVRLQTFVLAATHGLRPSAGLLRGCFAGADEYPENRSSLVMRALALLEPGDRAQLLLGETNLPWRYVACSSDPRVLLAAVAALSTDDPVLTSDPWVARAFHDWGLAGRQALVLATSTTARVLEALLRELASHLTPLHAPAELPLRLRRSVDAALAALEADPCAQPARTVIDTLIDYEGEGIAASSEGRDLSSSWAPALVAAYLRLPRSALVGLLRRFESTVSVVAPGDGPSEWLGRILVSVARAAEPVWLAARADDGDVGQVLAHAEALLTGQQGDADEACQRLERYAETADSAASLVARLASGAYRYAATGEPLDSPDSPPFLAVTALTMGERDIVAKARRARRFWQSFFLEVIPAAHAALR